MSYMTYPTVDMEATGQRIKDLRKAAGLTVDSLSRRLGVTPVSVHKWQRGINLPSVDNLVILANIYGCQIDDILVLR